MVLKSTCNKAWLCSRFHTRGSLERWQNSQIADDCRLFCLFPTIHPFQADRALCPSKISTTQRDAKAFKGNLLALQVRDINSLRKSSRPTTRNCGSIIQTSGQTVRRVEGRRSLQLCALADGIFFFGEIIAFMVSKTVPSAKVLVHRVCKSLDSFMLTVQNYCP